MKVETCIHGSASITQIGGTEVCDTLKEAIVSALGELKEIRGADVVKIAFHQTGQSENPHDRAIGTPLFAMILTLCSNDRERFLPSIGGRHLPITFFRTHDGKGCIVPHVAGSQRYEGPMDALIPGFAQTVLHVLTAEC